MARKSILLAGMGLILFPTMVAVAQISVEPPAPTTAPAATAPAEATTTAAPPATLPSAQSMLEQLKLESPESVPVQTMVKTDGGSAAVPQIDPVAPNAPQGRVIMEGRYIWKRSGRLVRDEKSDSWAFAFDADGKQMADPPMGLIPSRMLELMENASDNGTKQIKFEVSGEVTVYRKKNYLFVREALTPKDLNKGIGG